MVLEELISKIEKLVSQENLLVGLFYKMAADTNTYNNYLSGISDANLVKQINENNFRSVYQNWYSKSLLVLKFVLPERYEEFVSLYKPRNDRDNITVSTYTIYDSLEGIHTGDRSMNAMWGKPKLRNQISIISSLKDIIIEKYNDIETVIESEVLEKEIDCCDILFKSGFYRAAGSLAGVLLERDLKSKCDSNGIILSSKDPCINDYNVELYKNKNINSSQYKFIQYLGDIRNKCDHDKGCDPTKTEVNDLISGLKRVISVF